MLALSRIRLREINEIIIIFNNGFIILIFGFLFTHFVKRFLLAQAIRLLQLLGFVLKDRFAWLFVLVFIGFLLTSIESYQSWKFLIIEKSPTIINFSQFFSTDFQSHIEQQRNQSQLDESGFGESLWPNVLSYDVLFELLKDLAFEIVLLNQLLVIVPPLDVFWIEM